MPVFNTHEEYEHYLNTLNQSTPIFSPPISVNNPVFNPSSWGVNNYINLATGEPLKNKKEKQMSKKIGYKYNLEVQEAFRATHGQQKEYSGKIGLEIECEGKELWNNPFSYWVCKPDGSLRTYKGHSPIEYVLSVPLPRDKLDDAFAYMASGLAKSGSEVVDSPRTSVHVHVNQQGKTLRQVFTYLCGYLILEDILVAYAGEDRIGNTFCLRAKDAEYFIWLLEEAIKKDHYYELVNNEMRYTSCNVASLSKYGSLEFRALRGTVDSKVILAWVDILLELEAVCARYKSPQELLVELESLMNNYGPEAIVRYLLPKLCVRVLPYPDLKGTLWKAIRRVKDVAYATPVWKDEVPIKKTKRKMSGVSPDGMSPTYVIEETYEEEVNE